jgi:hypothetical protein
MLPRVRVLLGNGALGQVAASADKVYALLTTAAVVADKFALATTYIIRSLDDLVTDLGITAENNPGLLKAVTEFYSMAPQGTELWVRGYADTVTLTNLATLNHAGGIQSLLTEAKGRIRGIFIHRTPAAGYTPTTTEGIDADVITAAAAAQLSAAWLAETLKAPAFVIISGLYYQGTPATLPDLTTNSYNRVGVMIGDTVAGNGCAIGILAGRLASVPVQRNIGRVKDGPVITLTNAYMGSALVEASDVESVHDKGFITLRTHVGRAGYYFSDDLLATLPTDDYNHLTARRTVDKAYRIAYDACLGELLEEIPVNDQGQVSPHYAKSLETLVENAIVNSMTVNGELGNDPANQNDTGVECLVDVTQNIVSTGYLLVGLRVKPFGYSRYIDVNLGFMTVNQ